MANEVETILNEIRERVRAEEKQREAIAAAATQNGREGDGSSSAMTNSIAAESLARLEAHLTTTSRAWDRLPPVFSNRTGAMARLELWIKARLRSFSRWFTWEQVNFNSAVNHGLSDALEALRAHEQKLLRMQAELNQTKVEVENLGAESRQKAEALQGELARTSERLSEDRSRLGDGLVSELRQTAASLRADLNQTTGDLRATIDARAAEMNTSLAQLADDLHEEQTVCFKQLSLEASESATLEDRGRRAIEERLAKLERSSQPDKN